MTRSLSEVTRQEDRIFVTLPVSLRNAAGGGAFVSGNTVDYSQLGLRVRADLALQTGQEVVVSLQNGHNITRTYNVVWVRKPDHAKPTYEAGLKLRRDPLV